MRYFFIPLFIFSGITLFGQNCFEYHLSRKCTTLSKFSYRYNESSGSFLMQSGEVQSYLLEIKEGMDYKLTLCSDDIFTDKVILQILKEDETSLYSNLDYDLQQNVEFSCKNSQLVTIDVQAPAPAYGISDTIVHQGCIGLLIEQVPSVKTGF
jgi:hypothetical protein